MSSLNDKAPIQKVVLPMTNSANCLGTSITFKRKLTFSEPSETPKKCYDNTLHGKFQSSF